jgi:hypothetical protein
MTDKKFNSLPLVLRDLLNKLPHYHSDIHTPQGRKQGARVHLEDDIVTMLLTFGEQCWNDGNDNTQKTGKFKARSFKSYLNRLQK